MERSTFLENLFVSSLSATVTATCFQPLDVIKTVIQTHDGSRMRTVVASIYRRKNGISGFFRGLRPALIRTVPGVTLHFSFIRYLKTFSKERQFIWEAIIPQSEKYRSFSIGMISRTCVLVIVHPISIIKTRFEYTANTSLRGIGSFSDILKTLKMLYKRRLFFLGFWPTFFRDAPFSGIYLFIYDRIKQSQEKNTPQGSVTKSFLLSESLIRNGLASAFSSTISVTLTQPADVLRTHCQLHDLRQNTKLTSNFGLSFSCAKHIWKSYGLFGFYKGMLPRIMRRCLASALTWSIYDNILTIFHSI